MAESGTTRPQGTVRNLIRSQARRKPKNAGENSHQVREKIADRGPQQVLDSGTPNLSLTQTGSPRGRLPDPHGTPGNHVFDPFSPLPSVTTKELGVVQDLLKHCVSILTINVLSMILFGS